MTKAMALSGTSHLNLLLREFFKIVLSKYTEKKVHHAELIMQYNDY
jgi:hypothetical protein